MREIKFRGKAQDGKYYCGDLIHRDNVLNIRMCEGSNTYYIDVYPETVAQLVGYDADGNEVYEGDELVGRFNQVWVANVYCGAENNDDWTYYTDPKNLKLKKE